MAEAVLVGALAVAACAGGAKPVGRDNPPPPAARPTAAGAPGGSIDAELLKRGYRAQTHDGHLVYCRREAETGTRLASYLCRSAAQIRAEEEEAREALGPSAINRNTACPVLQACGK